MKYYDLPFTSVQRNVYLLNAYGGEGEKHLSLLLSQLFAFSTTPNTPRVTKGEQYHSHASEMTLGGISREAPCTS